MFSSTHSKSCTALRSTHLRSLNYSKNLGSMPSISRGNFSLLILVPSKQSSPSVSRSSLSMTDCNSFLLRNRLSLTVSIVCGHVYVFARRPLMSFVVSLFIATALTTRNRCLSRSGQSPFHGIKALFYDWPIVIVALIVLNLQAIFTPSVHVYSLWSSSQCMLVE